MLLSGHKQGDTDILNRLAAPKQFAVVTTYDDGSVRRHETETNRQADNYAVGERRKVGRELVSRESGSAVKVVSVTIVAL